MVPLSLHICLWRELVRLGIRHIFARGDNLRGQFQFSDILYSPAMAKFQGFELELQPVVNYTVPKKIVIFI